MSIRENIQAVGAQSGLTRKETGILWPALPTRRPIATAESSVPRNPHSSPPTFGLYKINFVKFFLVHFYSPGRASTGALEQNQNFTKLHFAIVFGLFDHKGSRGQKAQVIDVYRVRVVFREDLGRHAGSGRTTREKQRGQTGQGLAGDFGKDPEFHE